MREVIAAIREGFPDADQNSARSVFSMCWGRCRDCPNKELKNEQFYLLRPNSRMILKGRFYNCVAKSLAFQFCTF